MDFGHLKKYKDSWTHTIRHDIISIYLNQLTRVAYDIIYSNEYYANPFCQFE